MTVESAISARLKRLESVPDLSAPIYHNEDAAEQHLFQRRWGSGVECPRCASRANHWTWMREDCPTPYRLWRCRDCKLQFNLTSGTVMNARKRPLTYYLRVERLMREGILSARQVADLTDANYKWTWVLMKKIEYNGGGLI